MICPRECGADRDIERGFCGADSHIRIARAAKHMWEEPPISGKNGSGTIFFSGCSLGCEFCQNSDLSHKNHGKDVTPGRLYDIMFELKAQGVHNINLVTADHYIPYIAPVLKQAKTDGLDLPIVFNTSSYLKPQTLSMLSGLVDIYLADFKFMRPETALKYCTAPDYPEYAKSAVKQMFDQVGVPVIENNIMKSGVIVRVLVMPSNIIDAKSIIKYLYGKFGNDVCISVLGQYVPMSDSTHEELRHQLSQAAYSSVVRYAQKLNIVNGFMQSPGADDCKYIPQFDMEGV